MFQQRKLTIVRYVKDLWFLDSDTLRFFGSGRIIPKMWRCLSVKKQKKKLFSVFRCHSWPHCKVNDVFSSQGTAPPWPWTFFGRKTIERSIHVGFFFVEMRFYLGLFKRWAHSQPTCEATCHPNSTLNRKNERYNQATNFRQNCVTEQLCLDNNDWCLNDKNEYWIENVFFCLPTYGIWPQIHPSCSLAWL